MRTKGGQKEDKRKTKGGQKDNTKVLNLGSGSKGDNNNNNFARIMQLTTKQNNTIAGIEESVGMLGPDLRLCPKFKDRGVP